MTGRLLLDADMIRRRRTALGLSERDLAKSLGVTGFTVNALERGANHDDLPAGLIGALAEALALTPNELFNTPTRTRTADAALDVGAIGALLAGDGRLVPTAALAEVLDWPAERVTAALDDLAVRLPEVGQRLHRLGNDVSIVAAAAPPARLERLSRRVMAARGLTRHQAQLLYRAWHGQLTPTMPSNPDRVTLGVLTNAGLLTVPTRVTRGELPQLTDDVRFSLALDAPSRRWPRPAGIAHEATHSSLNPVPAGTHPVGHGGDCTAVHGQRICVTAWIAPDTAGLRRLDTRPRAPAPDSCAKPSLPRHIAVGCAHGRVGVVRNVVFERRGTESRYAFLSAMAGDTAVIFSRVAGDRHRHQHSGDRAHHGPRRARPGEAAGQPGELLPIGRPGRRQPARSPCPGAAVSAVTRPRRRPPHPFCKLGSSRPHPFCQVRTCQPPVSVRSNPLDPTPSVT